MQFLEAVQRVEGFNKDFILESTKHYENKITELSTKVIAQADILGQQEPELKHLRRKEEQSSGIVKILNGIRKCRNCSRGVDVIVQQFDAPYDWELTCCVCSKNMQWR